MRLVATWMFDQRPEEELTWTWIPTTPWRATKILGPTLPSALPRSRPSDRAAWIAIARPPRLPGDTSPPADPAFIAVAYGKDVLNQPPDILRSRVLAYYRRDADGAIADASS